MLPIEKAILLNKYGQGLIKNTLLLDKFLALVLEEKRNYLRDIISLIIQSKAKDENIETAITESNLKPTFTPCVLLRKGISNQNLQRIVELPENELSKSFILFLELFKVAYRKRFDIEKNDPAKWWYWDLSNESNLNRLTQKFKL